ncbi:MAG: adenylyltransferase/cytidyltransferase family protein [Oscillospiraceae bacterium]|nr:adenylyltransferase/cytidyltransferase family protein [Oscillospiraceae bacterium]
MTTAEANRKCAGYIRNGKERYDSEIRNVTDWDIFENLSSLRHAALYWYDFPENARVLELGCGSGALTGLLCDRAEEVYALDSDPVACDNVRNRFSGRSNLTVVNGNVDGFDPPYRFDLIVAVDFAELYKGDIRAALEKVCGMLADEGRLLLGIRNRNGIKYMCGEEDRYVDARGNVRNGISLYTEVEMRNILEACGFSYFMSRYPLPDLGFTQMIVSDDWMPENSIRDRIITYDPYGYGCSKYAKKEFEEYDVLIEGRQLAARANCIFIECMKREPECPAPRVTGAVLSSDRERDHSFMTVFRSDGSVTKSALYEESLGTLKQLFLNMEELYARGLRIIPQRFEDEQINMPLVNERPLMEVIRDALSSGADAVTDIFDLIRRDILRSSDCIGQSADGDPLLKKGFIDLIPYNAFYDGQKIVWYDQEFTVDNCPLSYIMFRAITYTWLHIPEAEAVMQKNDMMERYHALGHMEEYVARENAFTGSNRNRELFSQVYTWAWGNLPYRKGLVIGTFDLLHYGHENLFRRAKERCGFLRVGVMPDRLVKLYKGVTPAEDENIRLEKVRRNKYVDEAFLIEGDYVSKIAEWYRTPYDCFFSGDDYKDNEYWKTEADELNKLGAGIEFFPYTDSVSSTMLREELAAK